MSRAARSLPLAAAVNFWEAGLAAVCAAGAVMGAAVTVTVGAGVDGAQPAIARAPSSAAAGRVVRLMFIAVLPIRMQPFRPVPLCGVFLEERLAWGDPHPAVIR